MKIIDRTEVDILVNKIGGYLYQNANAQHLAFYSIFITLQDNISTKLYASLTVSL